MKRIKVLCIVLLVVFFGSIYQSSILPFLEGVKYGITVAKYQLDHKEKTDDFVLMDVASKDFTYLDMTEKNLKTGENVMIRTNNMTVLIHSLPNKPVWWSALQFVHFVLVSISLVLGIWVPFLVVKIINSLQRFDVFDRKNLKRIYRIGIIVLVIGILESILQTINVISAKSIVDLSHYDFTFAKIIDFNPIIMGVVILIMNDILRIGIELKEEHDLTV